MPNVKITPPSIIKVKMGVSPTQQRVEEIAYGSRKLKGALDLDLSQAADGQPITYVASTQSFVVLPSVDSGEF